MCCQTCIKNDIRHTMKLWIICSIKKQAPQAPLLFWRITKELHTLLNLQICIYFHINKATSIQINIQLVDKYTSLIFNESLAQGDVPDEWRQANVSPVSCTLHTNVFDRNVTPYLHLALWVHVPMKLIHLQFWAYGSWDSLFPISMSPTANLWVQNTIFYDKSAILLHPGTRWNKNFASQSQNYAQKMQDAQVTKPQTIYNPYFGDAGPEQSLVLFIYLC